MMRASTALPWKPMACALVYLCIALSLTACLEPDEGDPNVRDAIREVNEVFAASYQKMLEQNGTRNFAVNQATAITTMEHVLRGVGFVVRRREGNYYLHVSAPAPLPLNTAEWDLVRSLDEPAMREIAVRHLGIKGNLARLQPQGLEVHGYLTLLRANQGTDISLTMRMQETKPADPNSVLPRRDYPPPHAAQIGYEKIWQRFSAEIAGATQVSEIR